MAKNTSLEVGTLFTVEDINAWYNDNPLLPTKSDASFPLIENRKSQAWKTVSNASLNLNILADPISLNSKVPVDGRGTFKSIGGEMAPFGKGREMDADKIEQFEELKSAFAELGNTANAERLVKFYGDDLAYVRSACVNQKNYLNWALISSACNLGFVAGNSPYLKGLANMDYKVESWQKAAVTKAWSDSTALILNDIKTALDLAKTKSKAFYTITLNAAEFEHVRNNEQIQKYSATMVQNLFSTQSPPTVEAVNAMVSQYFSKQISFNVVDEDYSRMALNGTVTTANPFADGTAVFSATPVLGHFEWNGIPIIDPTIETKESFFTVGNVLTVNPNMSETYSKGRGMSVVDTYADNYYLKTNAVSW